MGLAAGVTATDAEDSAPQPTALRALIVTTYDVPVASPATEHGDVAQVSDMTAGPDVGVAITRYDRIGEPPSNAGGVNDTRMAPA
jgi:hypothetical protein